MTSPGDDTTQLSDDDFIIVADAVCAALKEFAVLRINLKMQPPNRGLVCGPVDRKRPRRRQELLG
jgi:hypothetical protein